MRKFDKGWEFNSSLLKKKIIFNFFVKLKFLKRLNLKIQNLAKILKNKFQNS
jgi:hypothetical protein